MRGPWVFMFSDMFLIGNMQAVVTAERHQSRFSTQVIWTDGWKLNVFVIVATVHWCPSAHKPKLCWVNAVTE